MQQVLSTCQHDGCVFSRWVTRRHGVCIDPKTDVFSVASHDVCKTVRGILTSYFLKTQQAKCVYTCPCVLQNTQTTNTRKQKCLPNNIVFDIISSVWFSSSATAFNDVCTGTWPPLQLHRHIPSHTPALIFLHTFRAELEKNSHHPVWLSEWQPPSAVILLGIAALASTYSKVNSWRGLHAKFTFLCSLNDHLETFDWNMKMKQYKQAWWQ